MRKLGDTILAFVIAWIRRLHEFAREHSWLVGPPLALQGGPVTIIVEFRQRGTRAVVPTLLGPGMKVRVGTVPLYVQDDRILLRRIDNKLQPM